MGINPDYYPSRTGGSGGGGGGSSRTPAQVTALAQAATEPWAHRGDATTLPPAKLPPEALAIIDEAYRGVWTVGTVYGIGDVVTDHASPDLFVCREAHTATAAGTADTLAVGDRWYGLGQFPTFAQVNAGIEPWARTNTLDTIPADKLPGNGGFAAFADTPVGADVVGGQPTYILPPNFAMAIVTSIAGTQGDHVSIVILPADIPASGVSRVNSGSSGRSGAFSVEVNADRRVAFSHVNIERVQHTVAAAPISGRPIDDYLVGTEAAGAVVGATVGFTDAAYRAFADFPVGITAAGYDELHWQIRAQSAVGALTAGAYFSGQVKTAMLTGEQPLPIVYGERTVAREAPSASTQPIADIAFDIDWIQARWRLTNIGEYLGDETFIQIYARRWA